TLARNFEGAMSRKLPFWLKTLYGSGDWGIASISMMRSIFYAIYLTDVVGIEPRLASLGALVGIVWDAVNDPIIGMLSDRVKSKLGRRRPFLLWFAFPFGLSFVMLWSAPNWDSQVALLIYVTLAFMISDTLTTLVAVPYYSLTPELTQNYDERTSLSSFRSVFQLLSAMVVVVSAPMIVDAVISGGGTQQQGFLTAGAVFGAIGSLPLFLIGLFIRERFAEDTQEQEELSFRETLKLAWQNVPFRYAVGIYMFNWSAVDMVSITFPFFLLYWVAQGDLLAKINILGVDLALESAFFGVLMLVCVLFVPFWLWLSKRQNKIRAYILGMAAWVVVQVLIFTIQPGETSYMLFLAGLAGIGVSAAYILPDSILPDVIEWDELRTGRRQEGIYYGIRTLIRKLTGALIIFITLQILGWSGYQAPPENVTVYQQPESALFMIRLMDSFIGAAILAGTIILAWSYPLTREKYQKIQKLLAVRRNKNAETT
ncbi:MAG TPA: MFS transporter, partial [Anaerolineales bacterium]|nr:MFS transporter [Anaerolineales bacterium]